MTNEERHKLYDIDEHKWLEETAAVYESCDKNLFRYLLEMSHRDLKELDSELYQLFFHMLKWIYQPERRGSSWQTSISKQARAIRYTLEHSGSILYKYREHALYLKPYRDARKAAAKITKTPITQIPSEFLWDPEQVYKLEYIENILDNF